MHIRTGEFTRGMLVVDRRDDVGAYAPGDNRSHVHQMLDPLDVSHGSFRPAAVPAPVIENDFGEGKKPEAGVFTLVETPGPRVCLELLLQRVWGISSRV